MHASQQRTGSGRPKCGSGIDPAEHVPQNVRPQFLQWCLRVNSVNAVLHLRHLSAFSKAGGSPVCC
jgi:hypothetical protein